MAEKTNDIVPELLERVQELYDDGIKKSDRIKTVKQRYNDGSITYADVEIYAMELGRILSLAYQKAITSDILPNGKMYWNIAERVIGKTLQQNMEKVEKLGRAVLKLQNENAGLGIKAVSSGR